MGNWFCAQWHEIEATSGLQAEGWIVVSLTLLHVLFVVIMTTVGASAGRFIRNHSKRLTYLKESVRAILFLLGTVAVVWYLAGTHASGVSKAGLAGLYIGLVYGLIASDPRPRRAATEQSPHNK